MLLCSLLVNNLVSTMSGENKVLIASLGGVKLVLSTLGNHSSHVGIQERGLRALVNLARNGSLRVSRLLSVVCVTTVCRP